MKRPKKLKKKTEINFNRVWAMPSASTYNIKPIKDFLTAEIKALPKDAKIIDPFAGKSPFADMCITNDLDEEIEADYHLDALDFLRTQKDNSCDMVLYDPPYSVRQVSECYKKLERTVNMETTQASFWTKLKNEVHRILKPNGIAITFGWQSGGIGKMKGFVITDILLVPHGGIHNDTIVTKEVLTK